MTPQTDHIEKSRSEERELAPIFEGNFERRLIREIVAWVEQGRPRKR